LVGLMQSRVQRMTMRQKLDLEAEPMQKVEHSHDILNRASSDHIILIFCGLAVHQLLATHRIFLYASCRMLPDVDLIVVDLSVLNLVKRICCGFAGGTTDSSSTYRHVQML
jgi:hypothetical protein